MDLAERGPVEAPDGGGDGDSESGWILRGLRRQLRVAVAELVDPGEVLDGL